MIMLFFQANSKVKEERKEARVLCLAKVGSLDPLSWAEAVSINVTFLASEFDLKVLSVCTELGIW